MLICAYNCIHQNAAVKKFLQGFAESLQHYLKSVMRKPYCVPYMEAKVHALIELWLRSMMQQITCFCTLS